MIQNSDNVIFDQVKDIDRNLIVSDAVLIYTIPSHVHQMTE